MSISVAGFDLVPDSGRYLRVFARIAMALAFLVLLLFPAASPALAQPPAPVPVASLALPDEVMLGEPFTFTVSFDNSSASTGYGPYLDLFLPQSGIDGSPAPGNDGILLTSATYLNAPVETTTLPCNSGATLTHPLTGLTVTCPAAPAGYTGPLPYTWQLNVLRLPFGSFVGSQPPVDVTINVQLSNLADVGTPLTVLARAGFEYGADPLDNPGSDPIITGDLTSDTTVPTLLTLTKEYSGPEDETATGPNYPRRYTLVVDIANGQTITNLDVIDLLPDNLQYLSFISATPGTCAPAEQPATGAPQNPPANRLRVRCTSATGGTGNRDVVVVFEYFVPLNDANGLAVIPAASGDDMLSIDDARAEGDWTPLDPRDTAAHPVSDITTQDHILTDKSIAIQKSVTNLDVNAADPQDSTRPGDRLRYTLTFQISDYFAFDSLAIQDVISDGQRFDPAFTPTLQINGNNYVLPAAAIDAANYVVTPNYTPASPAPNDGTTALDIAVSAEIIRRGGHPGGQMVGGCIPPGGTGGPVPGCSPNDGATTGTVVFQTTIQEYFSDEFGSNTPSVDQGDTLENYVAISGNVLAVSDLAPTGFSEADDSGASISILRGRIHKSIYAINGNTAYPTPVRIAAGDLVTYRIEYDLPTSDVERLYFIDYLPLPVFNVADVTPPFNPTIPAPPPSGVAGFGPADTFYAYSNDLPVLTTDPASNSLTFTYGDFDDPRNQPTHVDLVFTVPVRSDPFADGLYLTNQARAHEGSTVTGDVDSDSIIQLQLTEPVLRIRKGVMAANRTVTYSSTRFPTGVTVTPPGSAACPRLTGTVNSSNLGATFNSNVTGVDRGDLVTFAILVENTGSGLTGAFDVRLRDTLPAGFRVPAAAPNLNLCVTDGTGAALAYTTLGTGLFDQGIELVDPGGHGSLLANDPASGRNIAIILYDLEVDPTSNTVVPGANLVNTATLTNYAGSEGGPDHTATDLSDDAGAAVLRPAARKELVGTQFSHPLNTATQVVIGETVDYRVTLTLPEGYLPGLRVYDTLDPGLAFVDCLSISVSAGLSTSPGTFAGACDNPGISNGARAITYTLGNVNNANTDNAVPETIIIEYRAVLINVIGNQSGLQRNNAVVLGWEGGGLASVSADNVTVIEPAITVAKTALVNGGTSGDAGDPLQYTLTLQQPAISQTNAFDLTFSDPLPRIAAGSLIDNPTFTVTDSTGAVTDALFELVGSNATGWTLQTIPGQSFDWPFNATRRIDIVISGTLSSLVDSGQTIRNTATVQWTSLDGDPGQISTFIATSTERTGVGGVNDYTHSSSADITVVSPEMLKEALSTNLADTTGQNVAVGEQITYQVTYTISEGMSAAFVATDMLDAGLAFLQCNSVTASAALSSSTGFSCDRAVFSAVPAGSTAAQDQGRQMTLDFGNVSNSDNNNDNDETVVINYTALVTNSAAAARGAQLGNHAAGQWTSAGSTQTVQDSADPYTVVEPLLQTTKVANPTGGDSGDTILYTVTVTNAAAANPANAYNVRWTDTLPGDLTYVTGSLAPVSGVAPTLDASAAPTLSAVWDVLAPGESASISYQAVLDPSVTPQQVITNTQTVTGTSLPGDVPVPVSPHNPLSCERSGDPAACGGPENDYTANANATVTIGAPSFAKELRATSAAHTSGSNVAIGEVVTYALVVTLPEGTTPSLHIVDTLPASLMYLDGTVQLDLAGFAGTIAAPTVTPAGSQVTIDFGEITVTADNDPASNRFSILLSAVVLNHLANQNGQVLPNSAAFQVGTLDPVTPPGVDITVVEPELAVTKTASDDTPAFGQEITYTLRLSHLPSSTADAFEVVVTDTIPAGLTYVAGSITAPPGWTADDLAAPVLTFRGDLSLAQSTADFSYRVRVADYPDVALGSALTNPVTVSWTSLPGADPNQRDGTGGVNDYSTDTTETVTVSGPDLEIVKTDGGITGQPGLSVPYTLTYRNTGNGPAENVVITETVPQYTTFDADNSDSRWTCAPDENPGSVCRLELGTLNASASGSVIFSLLIDPSLPTTVVEISNTARIADDGANGPDPTPGNNSSTDTTPLVAAPDLVITKTDGVDVVAPGERLVYTLTIQNVGDQDATGVRVTDTLPAGVTFVSASNGGIESAGVITWPLFNLAAGQQVTRSVTVDVNDPYDGPTTTLLNTAAVEDDGANGDDPTPDNNEDEDEDEVATMDGNLSKAILATNQEFTTNPDVAIGEIVTYEVILTIPPGRMENVTVTDTLDRGLAFVECASFETSSPDLTTSMGTFTDVCDAAGFSTVPPEGTDPDLDGRRMALDLGTVENTSAGNQTLTLRYSAVVLNSELNLRGLSLGNAVRWQWTGGDLSRSARPVTIVEPTLRVVKSVKPEVTVRNGIVTFTLRVAHLPESNSDAFDVQLSDRVPAKLKYVAGSLKYVSGQEPTSLDDSGAPTLRARWDVFRNNGQNSVIQFKARVTGLTAGNSVTNVAYVDWSSLPGSVREPQSPHNDLSTERFYDPGSTVNIYGARDSVEIGIPGELPETGFAPGMVTRLPAQPAEKAYRQMGDIWLEIPSQNLKLNVVGVPAADNDWDLSWLGNQAGYLDGSAFPGLEGNTVLTAHVYDANGQPGPFAGLKSLKWGDSLVLHVYGQAYHYEVRQVRRHVSPADLSPLQHEEYSWLTLLTCEGYQEDSQSYRWRVAVRSVLVRIDP